MSGWIKDAIVDFAAFSVRPRSLCFDEIVSGAKLVRLVWSRNLDGAFVAT
jgi:hypothetical protein